MELRLIKKRCPFCHKEIKSLYPRQLDYNYKAHVLACKKKLLDQENKIKKEDENDN